MIDYDEALRRVVRRARPMPAVSLLVDEAPGKVLAGDIRAPFALPRFTSSAVDGYALRSDDASTADPSHPATLALAGVLQAGDRPSGRLKPRHAMRIFTGAPLPPGADTVVMQEHVSAGHGLVTLHAPSRRGDNVRRIGEEFRKGALVVRQGTPVTPPVVGLLAALGFRRVRVYRAPRVAIVVTGNELRAPGRTLTGGAIYDSNSPSLAGALQLLGIPLVLTSRVGDNAAAISSAFRRALASADVVISAGGVSVGDHDLVRDTCRSIGVRRVFWRVAMKPGRPLYFGTKRGKLLFAVPGNPVAALLSFHLFIRPTLLAMAGNPITPSGSLTVRLAVRITKKTDRTVFLRARLGTDERGDLIAMPVEGQESHMLGGLAAADCVIHFPARTMKLRAGEKVKVTVLQWSRP